MILRLSFESSVSTKDLKKQRVSKGTKNIGTAIIITHQTCYAKCQVLTGD